MNAQKPAFYVITGPAGSGKSTVAHHLQQLGFCVIPETYRWMRMFLAVESGPGNNRDVMFPGDKFDLQLAFEQFREDSALDIPGTVIMDRSCIDFYAYVLQYASHQTYRFEQFASCTARRIKIAFYLCPHEHEIPKDWLRREDKSQIAEIASTILYVYRMFGVHLVILENQEPKLAADKIAKLVQESI